MSATSNPSEGLRLFDTETLVIYETVPPYNVAVLYSSLVQDKQKWKANGDSFVLATDQAITN